MKCLKQYNLYNGRFSYVLLLKNELGSLLHIMFIQHGLLIISSCDESNIIEEMLTDGSKMINILKHVLECMTLLESTRRIRSDFTCRQKFQYFVLNFLMVMLHFIGSDRKTTWTSSLFKNIA